MYQVWIKRKQGLNWHFTAELAFAVIGIENDITHGNTGNHVTANDLDGVFNRCRGHFRFNINVWDIVRPHLG